MAGIAPVGTTASTPAIAIGSNSPALGGFATQPPAQSNFTAFPSSYQGFGNDGTPFGTVGVRNGLLSVFAGASAVAGAVTSAAIPPPPKPSPFEVAPLTLLGGSAPKTPGLTTHDSSAQSQPQQSAQQTQPTPQQQAAQAQQAQDQQQASAALSQRVAAFGSLVNVRLSLSFAQGQGNSAAVAQLTPLQTQFNAQFQGNQPFAGVGSTPPQPFAQPEIPRIFLNVGV